MAIQHARVRALAATTGARLGVGGQAVSSGPRLALEAAPLAPGTLGVDNRRLLLGCADGALELVEIQPAGRRRMDGLAWARGIHGELPVAARP